MIQLRYPVINNGTNATAQIQSFLHQLVDDLNYALQNIDLQANEVKVIATTSATKAAEEKSPKATFGEIKALIIKSADIVESFYDEFTRRLEGSYVAVSDFGTYARDVERIIQESAEGTIDHFSNLQKIIDEIGEEQLINVHATIKTGIVDEVDGVPIYGLYVGQETEDENGKKFKSFARFTSSRMSFYDSNENEVAYISDRRLYITNAEITGSLTLGGFVDTVVNGGVVTRWIGGEQ